MLGLVQIPYVGALIGWAFMHSTPDTWRCSLDSTSLILSPMVARHVLGTVFHWGILPQPC
jgi:hypothetical protein